MILEFRRHARTSKRFTTARQHLMRCASMITLVSIRTMSPLGTAPFRSGLQARDRDEQRGGDLDGQLLERVGRPFMPKIAKDGYDVVWSSAMKSQALNVNLTAELRRYVKEQV